MNDLLSFIRLRPGPLKLRSEEYARALAGIARELKGACVIIRLNDKDPEPNHPVRFQVSVHHDMGGKSHMIIDLPPEREGEDETDREAFVAAYLQRLLLELGTKLAR